MAFTLYWRLARTSPTNSTPGPVNTITTTDTTTGSWAEVSSLPPNTEYQTAFSPTGPWTNRRTLPTVDQSDRVEDVRTSFGDRPNTTPYTFYEAGRNEFLDPVTHPHIMGITHRTVKSGRWSDPTVWENGRIPGSGAIWAATAPYTLIYDVKSDVILKDGLIEFGAVFRLATDVETRMRIDYLMAMGPLSLVDPGTVPGKPKHEIIFHQSEAPGPSTRLGLMAMSSTRIVGAKKVSHLNVGLSPAQVAAGEKVPSVLAGATRAYLPGLAESGWQIGQVLMFGGTEFVPEATSDPQYRGPTQFYSAKPSLNKTVYLNRYKFGQEEQRTITGFDGNWVIFDSPLVYNHVGAYDVLPQGQPATIHPVVGNPSHSIELRSASFEEDGQFDANADLDDLQKRAHFMTMRSPDVDLRYFSLKNMARTDTNPTLAVVDSYPLMSSSAANAVPIANPNNVRGRYALHLHWNGGPYMNVPIIPVVGVSVWAPLSAPPIPGWGFTQHATKASFEDCFGFNVRGAAFVTELGNETGQWINCLAMFVRGDGEGTEYHNRSEDYTNHNDSAGHGFGNQSRAIIMHGNIAVSCKHGAVWHGQKTNRQDRAHRDIDLRFKEGINMDVNISSSGGFDQGIGHILPQIPPMINNVFINCSRGFAVVHRLNSMDGVGLNDNTPMLMEDFYALNCEKPWIIPEYSNTYYVKNAFIKFNNNMPSTRHAFTLGNVSWGWNFSNIKVSGSSVVFVNAGAGINYNGFFMDVEHDSGVFANTGGTFTRTGLTTAAYWDIMGDSEIVNADTGVVRRYVNKTVADFPIPYPKAPYGYGAALPAGYSFPQPGEAPYFIPGSAFNGGAGWNVNLNAGTQTASNSVHGMIVDCVGIMRWPDSQSHESFPNNLSVKTPKTLKRLRTEDLIERWGVWNDNGVWKCRAWFLIADRYTHVRSAFHIDYVINSSNTEFRANPDFLAAHDLGGPSQAPAWPDKIDMIPPHATPIKPVTKTMEFYSRTYLQAVLGENLEHNLHANDVNVEYEIVGGTHRNLFRIVNRQLRWASGLAPTSVNSNYTVVVRVKDVWGNFTDATHTVRLVSNQRYSPLITDTFSRADELMTANPNYIIRQGPADAFGIRNNVFTKLLPSSSSSSAAGNVIDLGSLGSSDQEAVFRFIGEGSYLFLMRMEDHLNWIGIQRIEGSTPHGRVLMCVNGTTTILARFDTPGSDQVRVILKDQSLNYVKRWNVNANRPLRMFPRNESLLPVATLNPKYEYGSLILPDNSPKGVHIGVNVHETSTSTKSLIGSLTAKAIV